MSLFLASINQSAAPRRGPGCFGYGCLIATVIFCLVIGGAWFVGLRSIRGAVKRYTATSVEPLAPMSIEASAENAARLKWDQLNAAALAGQNLSLEFTEGEVQALIHSTAWRDWVRVSLEGDEAGLSFSFPLGALGDWVAASFLVGDIKDRGLVGSARVRLARGESGLHVSFQELVLNDQVLEDLPRGHAGDWVSGAFLNALKDPELGASLPPVCKSLQDVQMRDGRLVVAVGRE
jgi:hypothetical protein